MVRVSEEVGMEIGVYCPNDEHYPDAPPGVGSVAKVVDDIARMAELGVQHLELAMPPGPTTEAILEQMHRFADDVRPQLPATTGN